MSFARRSLLAVAALASGAGSALAQSAPAAKSTPAAESMPADSLAHARKLTAWFFSGQADSVHAYMAVNDSGKKVSTDEIRATLERMTGRAGAETKVVEEKFVKRNGSTQYWRTGEWSEFTDEPVVFRWAFNKSGRIVGIGFNPLSKAPPIDPN